MEAWATFSIIDHLKPIGDQTQEELDQLEAVDYLRETQAGGPSFCREFTLSDAPETRSRRGRGLLQYLQGIILSRVSCQGIPAAAEERHLSHNGLSAYRHLAAPG